MTLPTELDYLNTIKDKRMTKLQESQAEALRAIKEDRPRDARILAQKVLLVMDEVNRPLYIKDQEHKDVIEWRGGR